MNITFVTKLNNAEYVAFNRAFKEIVEKYNPELIGIMPVFEELDAFASQVSILIEPRSKHPLTPSIQEDEKRMRELCGMIETQLGLGKKGKKQELDSALLLIEPFAKKYLAKQKTNTRTQLNENVEKFLDIIGSEKAMSDAAKLLNVDVYIAELSEVKGRMIENSATRGEAELERRIQREMQIRKTNNQNILILLKAIDVAKVVNKTFDFSSLNTELGFLFDTYNSKIKARATRNLNNAIKKESAASTTKSVATETLEDGLV